MQLPLPTGGDGVHIKHESAHIGSSAHTEALGGSLSNVIWQPTAAEIWLNKLKLLALGVILYKLKSSIRAAWKKSADVPMCADACFISTGPLALPLNQAVAAQRATTACILCSEKKHPLTFYFISP